MHNKIDLRQKSQDSFGVCCWAITQQQYHIAISRLYYAVYQRICFVVSEQQTPDNQTTNQKKAKKKTHHNIIETFCQQNPNQYAKHKDNIERLKKYRNLADYKPSILENDKETWGKCIAILNLLNKLECFKDFSLPEKDKS